MKCHELHGVPGGPDACWEPGGCCYFMRPTEPVTFPRESQLHIGPARIKFEFEGTPAEFAEWCARYARGQA